MKDATLVIMAAGMGSRYGGLKQLDPVGPSGEIIIEYSIFDAIKAGFNKIVFIIKKELENDFKNIIGDKISKSVKIVYVFQDIDNIPAGFSVPQNRKKPWGTAHAVLCCQNVINEPFAVINADDYYGRQAFELLYDNLTKDNSENETNYQDDKYHFFMIGYNIANTLTENGTVARGVCVANKNGELTSITEHTKIAQQNGEIIYTDDDINWIKISENSIVSMNCWGFSTDIFKELTMGFSDFLQQNNDDLSCREFFLPYLVNELVEKNKAVVNILRTSEKWYGVTYKPDKPTVIAAILKMVKQGKYPERLWNND